VRVNSLLASANISPRAFIGFESSGGNGLAFKITSLIRTNAFPAPALASLAATYIAYADRHLKRDACSDSPFAISNDGFRKTYFDNLNTIATAASLPPLDPATYRPRIIAVPTSQAPNNILAELEPLRTTLNQYNNGGSDQPLAAFRQHLRAFTVKGLESRDDASTYDISARPAMLIQLSAMATEPDTANALAAEVFRLMDQPFIRDRSPGLWVFLIRL
jgi:hypothetical protein